jgi:hypothetical protein
MLAFLSATASSSVTAIAASDLQSLRPDHSTTRSLVRKKVILLTTTIIMASVPKVMALPPASTEIDTVWMSHLNYHKQWELEQ